METLRLLAQHGADLWARNAKGDVALHEAVASGRKDLVLWLLRSAGGMASTNQSVITGPSPSVPGNMANTAHVVNNEGRSPLHVAAVNNNVEMCKVSRVRMKRRAGAQHAMGRSDAVRPFH